MSFLTFGQNEQLTLWVLEGTDGFNQPLFAAPVQRQCRWEERTTRIQGPDDQEVLSRSRIFLAESVKIGDFIARGIVAGADPREIFAARVVLDYRETPSLDAVDFERKAYT